jgi:mRNA interferase RelE/StbE
VTYEIDLESAARRAIRKLPDRIQAKVRAAIYALAYDPRPHGCLKMVGFRDRYRVRVGRDYRVIYEVHDKELIVVVVTAGDRRDVYS